MTKGTGECFAEVLFRVKDGKIYRKVRMGLKLEAN